MKQQSTFEHQGLVKNIDQETIYIDIEVQSACAQCHAKGYCSTFGKQDKVITVPLNEHPEIRKGDIVNVIISERRGLQALVLGYLLPVIILLAVLIPTLSITSNEGTSALIALFSVVLYYLTLIPFRKRFKKHFSFRIEKL